jgi:nitrogenase-associated protein
MAVVVFYEKPGCKNNTRQKELLAAAGHTVEARDIQAERWTPERLMSFFGDRTVPEWFNRSAPAVKSGEVAPDRIDARAALAMMCADPLLIRRPLMQSGGTRTVGWNEPAIRAWLDLGEDAVLPERCPEDHDHPCEGH